MGVKLPDESKLEQIAEGVLKKKESDNTYYIQCKILGTWHYCNEERLKRLIAKHGSVESLGREYVSRNGSNKLKESGV